MNEEFLSKPTINTRLFGKDVGEPVYYQHKHILGERKQWREKLAAAEIMSKRETECRLKIEGEYHNLKQNLAAAEKRIKELEEKQ